MAVRNKSKDPVLVKKIVLRIWTLRSEIESAISTYLAENKITSEEANNLDISKIMQEYSGEKTESPKTPEGLTLVPNLDAAASEDDMAKAMAEEMAQTEKKEEAPIVAADASTPEEKKDDSLTEKPAEEVKADSAEVVTDTATSNIINDVAFEQVNKIEKDKSDKIIVHHEINIPEDQIINAKTILSEINMNTMFFFCNKKLMEGQSIVVEFVVPNRFILNGEVVYCSQYNMKNRIIKKVNLAYRAAIKFTFKKQGERTLLRKFIKSIEPSSKNTSQKIQASPEAASAKSGDGIEDLLNEL